MARRYFNWKLVVTVLLALVIVAVSAIALRQWRRTMRAESGLRLGDQAYEAHNYAEAASQYGRYIGVYPNDVEVLLKYADSQMNIRPLQSRNLQQAIAAYRSVLRIDKANSDAAETLTGLYLSIDVPGEAELVARRYLEIEKNPLIRRNLASAYIAQKKFDEAEKELKNIISDDPSEILAYEMLGKLAMQRSQDFQMTAEDWFNEAVNNNMASPLAYIVRAGFYRSTNNPEKALADLQRAEQMDFSDMSVRLRLAVEYVRLEKVELAEKHLAVVQKENPQNLLLWQTWVQIALKSGDVGKMHEVADAGLTAMAEQPWDFMPFAAELFIQTDDLERAEECIQQMNQKGISSAFVAFLEGLIANRRNQSYEAIKAFQRSIELGNKSPRTRLALAAVYSQLGNTRSALRQAELLVSEMPDSYEAHLAYANLLAQTGQWAALEEESKKAASLSPGDARPLLLNLRARIQLAARNTEDEDPQVWSNIEEELNQLDQATSGVLDVKLLRCQYALLKEDLTSAEQMISQLKNQYPENIKVLMTEALLLSEKKMYDQALSLLSNAIKKFPQSVELLKYYALFSIRDNKYADCETFLEKVLSSIDDPSVCRQASLLLFEVYRLSGDEELAYRTMAELDKKQPQDILIKRQLLLCEQVHDDPLLAQQLVDAIKSIEGEKGWQWRYEQAKLWYTSAQFTQRYPQIVAILKENLLANPGDNDSRVLLAQAHQKAGEYRLAALTFKEALDTSPDDIRLIVLTASALQQANEYTQADELLARAGQQKLFTPELQRLELQSYFAKNELKSAGQLLEEMLKDDPENVSVCLSLASLKIQQHDYAEAEELLRQLRLQQPNSLAVIEKMVTLNMLQNKSTEAISLCNEAVNALNNADAYLLRGRILAVQGQTDKAVRDYEQATIIESDNAIVWLAKSEFERSQGQFDRAAMDVEHAIDLEPEDLQVTKRAIVLYLGLQNRDLIDQGLILLDNALKANPNDYQLQLLKAQSLLIDLNYQNIQKAKAILRSVTETHPMERQAWLLRGRLLMQYENNPNEALGIAVRALAHNPNDKNLIMLKAQAELAMSPSSAVLTLKGLLEEYPRDIDVTLLLNEALIAASQFQNAITLLNAQKPVFQDALYERELDIAMARALYKNRQEQAAVQILDTLYRTDPNDTRVLNVHVQLLEDDKRWDQATQKIRWWYQQHPNHKLFIVGLAEQLAGSGNDQAKTAAEDVLNLILKDDPENIEALMTLGILYDTRGQSVQAANLYQKILELKPDQVIAMNNLAWILFQQDQYERALELAQKGLEIAPNYTDLIDTRGMIYTQLNRKQEAVKDFTRAIELYLPAVPARTASYFHLGKVLYELNEEKKATDNLREALNLNEKIGGLSPSELMECRQLLETMSKVELTSRM